MLYRECIFLAQILCDSICHYDEYPGLLLHGGGAVAALCHFSPGAGVAAMAATMSAMAGRARRPNRQQDDAIYVRASERQPPRQLDRKGHDEQTLQRVPDLVQLAVRVEEARRPACRYG